MTKWEYERCPDWGHSELEKLGQDGYEAYGIIGNYIYLKRPIEEPMAVSYDYGPGRSYLLSEEDLENIQKGMTINTQKKVIEDQQKQLEELDRKAAQNVTNDLMADEARRQMEAIINHRPPWVKEQDEKFKKLQEKAEARAKEAELARSRWLRWFF